MLQPSNIRQEWDQVRPHLLELIAKNGDPFLPEDIFALCVSGEASFYLDPDSGTFCVLQKRVENFTEDVVLFIFAAWTPPAISIETYWPEIVSLAQGIGAKKVKMNGTRKGWEKRSEWTQDYVCYERSI